MATTIYYEYGMARNTANLNTKWKDIVPAGKYKGFTLSVLDGAARTLRLLTDSDESVLVTPEGAKILETATVAVSGAINVGGASDRYDIVYCEYTHGPNAQPSYGIIVGTVGGGIPALTDTDHQFRLGYVLMPAGATTISDTDVTSDDTMQLSVQDMDLSGLDNVSANVEAAILADTTATVANPFLTQDAIIGDIERENIADFRPYASTTADAYLNIATGTVLNSSGQAVIQMTTIYQEDLSGYLGNLVSVVLDDTGTFTVTTHAGASVTAITDLPTDSYPIAIVDMTLDAVVSSDDITDIRGGFTRGINSVYGLGELSTDQGAAIANIPSTASATNPLIPSTAIRNTMIGCGVYTYKVSNNFSIKIQPGYIWNKDTYQWIEISTSEGNVGPYALNTDVYWEGGSEHMGDASACWLYIYLDFDNNRPIILGVHDGIANTWTPTDPDMDMYTTYSGQSVRLVGVTRIVGASQLYEIWTGDGKRYYYCLNEGDRAANVTSDTVKTWGHASAGGMYGYQHGTWPQSIIPKLAKGTFLYAVSANTSYDDPYMYEWCPTSVYSSEPTFWRTMNWGNSSTKYVAGWEIGNVYNVSEDPATALNK